MSRFTAQTANNTSVCLCSMYVCIKKSAATRALYISTTAASRTCLWQRLTAAAVAYLGGTLGGGVHVQEAGASTLYINVRANAPEEF